ncbi:MAG TPA: hypothetical protein VNE82_14465 [Candidatus Binataceae bacterium]|nr:hypothetical protein [Candidatus Binataceae bacterium]
MPSSDQNSPALSGLGRAPIVEPDAQIPVRRLGVRACRPGVADARRAYEYPEGWRILVVTVSFGTSLILVFIVRV